MRLLVYDTYVNGIYYVHVCEQARWARSAGNSAIENLRIIINNVIIKSTNNNLKQIYIYKHNLKEKRKEKNIQHNSSLYEGQRASSNTNFHKSLLLKIIQRKQVNKNIIKKINHEQNVDMSAKFVYFL